MDRTLILVKPDAFARVSSVAKKSGLPVRL